MSEFKISCPNCQQNIQVTSEYSGLQINCPACNTALVVPVAPDAPASAPAPAGPRLSKVASTSHEPSASATAAASFYAAKPVKKKKPKTKLIVGISVGVVAVAAGIYFWPEIMKKINHANDSSTAATAAADTNVPPPPPPELTTEEIMDKVGETYKGLTDYAATAKTTAELDMSALVPGAKSTRVTTTSSLQLGRTNYYRMEWEQNNSGATIKGAAWSAGKGNFVGYGPTPPSKVKTRQLAFAPASQIFLLLSDGIAELFFADTNSFARQTKDFTRTNSSEFNGGDSYVLTGQENHLSVLVWVKKDSFLVTQIEVFLGGTVDEEELKKLPSTQRAQMKAFLKIKGTITETYDHIQTNQHLLASAFESAYRPAGNPGSAPANSGAPIRKRAGSMAEQLTQPRGRPLQGPPPQ